MHGRRNDESKEGEKGTERVKEKKMVNEREGLIVVFL